MNRSLKAIRLFSRVTETYDQQNLVQRFAAQRLATKILTNQKGSSLGSVLEVGCGSGTLTKLLASSADHYIATDFGFSLLQKIRDDLPEEQISPVVFNGECPCFTASFDVIVSNLMFHWFQDPKNALGRLAACLKPGGKLYLSMFGNNTFYEWRTAHSLVEAPCGVLDFVSFGQLKDWFPLSGNREVEEEWVTMEPANALEFLRSLKAMGGRLSHPGHKPLPYKIFKKVMQAYEKKPRASCQILYGVYQRPEKIREE